uniref:EamA domain-containing protein n=1 Tax=Ananas comosus var. bracteatus TaxID=296719 RepID=A0A6V7NLL2_ANACO|nr:unnamed protein product [Ananas comosus var. bracteatus]
MGDLDWCNFMNRSWQVEVVTSLVKVQHFRCGKSHRASKVTVPLNPMGNYPILAIYVMHILMKATFNEGMSTSVFVFYRQSVATLFLVPVAFLLERKSAPPLQYMVALKIFALAFCGISGLINIYNIGLNYTTATSASAMFNIMPVIAFILAVLFRMETVKLNRMHGMVKTSGIVLCLAGVITLALYQGPELKLFTHRYLLHHTGSRTHGASSTHSKKSWVLGVFLMVMSTAAWALWAVLQGPLLLEYPSKLLNTALQCLFSTIQSFFLALIIERDFSRWKIGLDVSLISVIYCGIIVSGVSHYLQSWTIEKKGPVFLTMSMPLTLVITIILSTILLGEAISLGSVLGGVLLVGGLYNVLWGRGWRHYTAKKKQAMGLKLPWRKRKRKHKSERNSLLILDAYEFVAAYTARAMMFASRRDLERCRSSLTEPIVDLEAASSKTTW